MQIKIFLTKKELTQIAQQATLINEIEDDTLISVTIDDNRIAVDVPNMVRSIQREIVVDKGNNSDADTAFEAIDRFPVCDEQPTDIINH